jgi:general secretion pathway protein D
MKAVTRCCAVLFVATLTILPVFAQSAGSFYKKGTEAETRQDYEAAYEFFRQAREKDPKDLRVRSAYDRTRFLASAAHIHRGQQLRQDGKLGEAQAEFEKALKIDPSGYMAQQELRRLQFQIAQANDPNARPALSGTDAKVAQIASPVQLAPLSTQPITLHLTEDSKSVYSAVGKLAGLNVIFDPDYNSKRITVDLTSVNLDEAMRIVALESHTFWRAITPNTIYVATDSTAKRKDLEPQSLRTFYLANVAVNTDINDVVNALRTVLELKFAQAMPNQNAVVVRGTPDQLALAEKLINDIDKARPEVIVDVAIMEVSREKVKNLGLVSPLSSSTAASVTLETLASTSGSSSTSSLTLNTLKNLSSGNFALSLPSATLTALLTDSNTKILENPQVRSVDGQKASLKIGTRVPSATGSTSAASTTSSLVSSTSFTYIDVGVNIDITPHIHANRDVSLKVVLEVSSVTGYVTIAGVSEPEIGQHKYENEIWVKDGEECLLGGMFEQHDTKTMKGMPWLSQVPVLKYLFGEQDTDKLNDEMVISLTPHVVRMQDVDETNTRPVDVGTASNVSIHYNPPIVDPAADAAPATVRPPRSANQPASQPAPVAGQGAVLGFEQPTVSQKQGETFSVNVQLGGGQNIAALPMQLHYDARQLQLVNITSGGVFSRDGQVSTLVHREDEAKGISQITLSRPPGAPGVSGDGSTVLTLTFVAMQRGQSVLAIEQAQLRDSAGASQPVNGAQAVVSIR